MAPRTKLTLVLVPALTLLAACSAKTSSVSMPDVPQTYQLESGDVSKLESVGCHVSSSAVNCDDPKPTGDDRLSQLQSYKQRVDQQAQAVKDVQAALDARIKSNKLGNRTLFARVWSSVLSARAADLTSRSSSKAADIADEQLYLQVLGYACDGSYVNKDVLEPVTVKILSRKKGAPNFKQDFGSQSSGLSGTIQFITDTGHIIWLGDDGTNQNIEHAVNTDGEFMIARHGVGSDIKLNCLKYRASGPATQITDRPVTKRILKCRSSSTAAHPATDDKPKAFIMDDTFEVQATDASKVTELGGQNLANSASDHDDLTEFLKKIKYFARVTSNGGLLKFEAYDSQTKQTVYEVTTSNSTPNIGWGLKDTDGNTTLIQCGDDIK